MEYWDYRSRLAFIQVTREACRHEQAFARIYQALADRSVEGSIHDLWLHLAEVAASQAEHDAARLHRLGVRPLPGVKTWWDHVWRTLLVRHGSSFALAWLERTRQHDLHRMAQLALLARER